MKSAMRLLILPLVSAACMLPLAAQTAAAPSMPLVPPAGIVYQYWPMQLVQFVGNELPYSMILLDADKRGPQPVYDVTLTDRASAKQIHYVNQAALLALDKAKGQEAFLTRMQFDEPDAPGKGAQYVLRFNTEKNVPVEWQWIQGTDVSEQGSGMSPIDAPVPVLMYREQGALAGEGTALKIGGVTSVADVWKEFAQPPYFVPYHGALSEGVHIVVLAPVTSDWTTTQAATGPAGGSWELKSAHGTTLAAKNEQGKNGGTDLMLSNAADGTSLELTLAAGGAGIERVQMGPTGAKIEHTVSIAFSPALSPGATSQFELIAGKKQKLGGGSVETKAAADGVQESWTLSKPDWAKGKTAVASASLHGGPAGPAGTPATTNTPAPAVSPSPATPPAE